MNLNALVCQIEKEVLEISMSGSPDAAFVYDVGLTVESRRPDAHTFYTTVGMRQVRQYDEFLKLLI